MRRILNLVILATLCILLAEEMTAIAKIIFDNATPWVKEKFSELVIEIQEAGKPSEEHSESIPWWPVIEAVIWLVIIYWIIIPVFRYPILTILPIVSIYKDSPIIRLTRYITLVMLAALIPFILFIILPCVSEYFRDISINHILNRNSSLLDEVMRKSGFGRITDEVLFIVKSSIKDSGSKTLIELHISALKTSIFFDVLMLSLASILITHYLIFGASEIIAKISEFFDEGKTGRGGSGRFSNLMEEACQRWKKGTSLYLGNSHFIPWMKLGVLGHMLTIAGTRAGKGACAIIPNLVSWQGSVLCVDSKGENYIVTHKKRRDMGQNVYVLDPMNEKTVEKDLFDEGLEKSDCFNVLEELDIKSNSIVEDIGIISEALILDSGKDNKHFTSGARSLVSGYIAHVISSPQLYPSPSLIDVYGIITSSVEDKLEIHAHMMRNDKVSGMPRATAARILESKGSKEFQSIYATAVEQMRWIGTVSMQKILKRSTFRMSELREKPTTLYLIIPSMYLEYHTAFQRLVINAAFISAKKGGISPTPYLFMIDEAASLGHMTQIKQGFSYDAGYNIFIWLFFQNKRQIDDTYGHIDTFIGNSGAVQVFGVEGEATKYISDRLGRRPLSGTLGTLHKAETAPFRSPEEVVREVKKEGKNMYIVRSGQFVSLAKRVPYFSSFYWCDKAGENPDYKGKKPLMAQLKAFLTVQHRKDAYRMAKLTFKPLLFVFTVNILSLFFSVPTFIEFIAFTALTLSWMFLGFSFLAFIWEEGHNMVYKLPRSIYYGTREFIQEYREEKKRDKAYYASQENKATDDEDFKRLKDDLDRSYK